MDKKITRRAVLGTIIGGLAVAPFVVYSLRNPRGIPQVAPYGKVEVEPSIVDSGLTPEDVRQSFDTLSVARDSFLKFRGFTGNVQIHYNSSGKVFPSGVSKSGYFSLQVDLTDSMRAGGGVAIDKVDMKFSPQKGMSPSWTFLLNGTRSPDNPPVINNEAGDNTDIFLMYQLVLAPISLVGLVNGDVIENLKYWKVSRDAIRNVEAKSFVFEPNDTKLGSEGLLPTIGVTDGYFSEYIPKRVVGQPYPLITFEDYVGKSGAVFPTQIKAFADGQNPSENDCVVISFSDVVFV